MKELTIRHIPAKGRRSAQVSVSYRAHERAQPQTAPDASFRFEISDEQRRLIQWYLEEYLQYPWGELNTRAQSTEALLDDLGRKLFEAVFRSTRARTLYGHIADDLANTRIVVQAEATDATGLGLPWELLRDPDREFEIDHFGALMYFCVDNDPAVAEALAKPHIPPGRANAETLARCTAFGPPALVRERLEEYVDAGGSKFILRPMCPPEQMMEQLQRLAEEVVPDFQHRR